MSECVYNLYGSGALSGKMLLVRIIENNKIYAYLGQFGLSKRLALPLRVIKGIRIEPCRMKIKKTPIKLIFNNPRSRTFYREVHLILNF